MKNPDTTNGGTSQNSYLNSQSKDKNFLSSAQKLKHLLPPLIFGGYNIENLIEVSLDHLNWLEDCALQTDLRWYHYHLSRYGKDHERTIKQREKCEMLQDALAFQLAQIAAIQANLEPLKLFQQAHHDAKNTLNTKKYAVVFVSDLDATEEKKLSAAVFDLHNPINVKLNSILSNDIR